MTNKTSKKSTTVERQKIAKKKAQTQDGLVNLMTGLGTNSTKRGNNRFEYTSAFINHTELDAAYREEWLARQIVDVPAEDALREGRTFTCDDAIKISKEEERLGVLSAMQEAYSWSRLYGGSIIVMMTTQDLARPLNVDRIGPGDLKNLIVFERFEISSPVMNTTNPLADNYLEPEFYTVAGGNQKIHYSHVIRFDGVRLPRRLRYAQDGWGDSELRKVMQDLADIVASKGGVAELIQEANVDTITREGLSSELSSDQESEIISRYSTFRQMKSMFRLALLDGDETYDRKEVSFSGINGVLEEFRIWISGAADIPVTRLFGTSASGLNATGEGDLKNYYDSVRAKQKSILKPRFDQLDQVLVRSAVGRFPDDCEYDFNPLVQQSGAEVAQEANANAQTDRIYLDDGIIKPEHVAKRLQQEGRYAITDEDVKELENGFEEGGDSTGSEDLLNGIDNPTNGGGAVDPGKRGTGERSEPEETEPETES